MKKQNIIKIFILLLLTFGCIWKFTTYLPEEEPTRIYIKIEPIIDTCVVEKTPQELAYSAITNRVTDFYCALKERNIPYAASLSSERGIYSLLALPIEEIEDFKLTGIVIDRHIAEVETTINHKIRTLVFLQKKKKDWIVNGVIADKTNQ